MNKKYIVCLFLMFLLTISVTIYAQTQKAQSSIYTTKASGDNMVELLARLINGEARGEPYIGQVAVGAVIMNRVNVPNGEYARVSQGGNIRNIIFTINEFKRIIFRRKNSIFD